ncbi:acetate--CoA ligase family protein [Salipiger sp. P9]|uniref:acetate--CoA ligase family protein n=1 Tax=Salipiger pentaromativorans TaxID=2943193 RepID=UPI00215790A1|nr:acetate--CoA ligase family protein [Salipiger pentaromativorans]MCR8547495.1 acetate--CoA ligase family protein [Salipiger pentaromativorans]
MSETQAHPLDALMAPASIAVIGASPRGNRGTVILRNIRERGFEGALYAINPKYGEIEGVPCFPSISALPTKPDFLAIALPAAASVAALREAAAAGIPAGLMIAGGFAEGSGIGADLQAEAQQIARDAGMKICGPNCYGIVNVTTGAAPYSGGIVEPLTRGNVGFVLQSGALTHALHDTLVGRGPGISAIVTSGNEAVVELAEYVDWLLDDPNTDVIALFIEGLKNPARFAEVAEKALRLGKPIVALKAGRTERGQRATLAHTGSVAGSDAAYEGLFCKLGVIRAEDIDDMRETLVLLASGQRPVGDGVAIASISGGITTMLTDLAETCGLNTPAPSAETQAKLAAALPDFGIANNPLDTTGVLAENPAILAAVAEAFLSDPQVGCFALALNTPLGTEGHRIRARMMAEAQAGIDKPLVCFSVTSYGVDPDVVQTLGEQRIPMLMGARETVLALSRWVWFEERRRAFAADRGRLAAGKGQSLALPAGETVLAEREATALLQDYGMSFTPQGAATEAEAAATLAENLGFPVVLKIDSPDIAHKTEAGGVKLGLRDAGEVKAAFAEIMTSAAAYDAKARIDGVLVQKMAPKGFEVLLGLTRHGAFGLQMAVGIGGTFVEILRQVALRPLPVSRADAEEMVDETLLGDLLGGFRGSGPYDRAALIEAILALSDAACDLGDRLDELDVNPLLVLPEGQGVMALDALIVLGN